METGHRGKFSHHYDYAKMAPSWLIPEDSIIKSSSQMPAYMLYVIYMNRESEKASSESIILTQRLDHNLYTHKRWHLPPSRKWRKTIRIWRNAYNLQPWWWSIERDTLYKDWRQEEDCNRNKRPQRALRIARVSASQIHRDFKTELTFMELDKISCRSKTYV